MTAPSDLKRLARHYGVLTRYRDGFRKFREPSNETLLAILKALGVPLEKPDDAAKALAETRQSRWSRLSEPVAAIWGTDPGKINLSVPRRDMGGKLDCSIQLESGDEHAWSVPIADLASRRTIESYRQAWLALPKLPIGYHRLALSLGAQTSETLLICAPQQAVQPEKTWGVFLPLYALHTENSIGIGDFSDLASLIEWTKSLGGGIVGTLPLMATFPDAPSPYTPVSRLYWNELYADPRATPEWSSGPQPYARENSRPRYVDYSTVTPLRRAMLERTANNLSAKRADALRRHTKTNPGLLRYAAYRAHCEQTSRESAFGQTTPPFDWANPDCLYHAYAQWVCEEQLQRVAALAGQNGAGLYLDLPLGVHPQGFDRHQSPGLYAQGVTGGAPPDRFFSKGQNWAFAPLNPAELRESGHAYFIESLRAQLKHAGVLRIDHLMGLHRLYWIPPGAESDQGTYVQYPANEFYAIVCLESQRAGAAVIGEDLGTVPKYVRERMKRHGLHRMFVAQFEFKPDADKTLPDAPPDSIASINTHDTPTFASFWSGEDVRDQQALGLLNEQHAAEATDRRDKLKRAVSKHFEAEEAAEILEACLAQLGASEAAFVIANLEDLWGETLPQNTPGTDKERPNWSRRARLSLEELSRDPRITEVLRKLSTARPR